MNEIVNLDSEHIQGRQQVERFVQRFEPSYLQLAYYAALPLILTPELLNYLRYQLLRNVRVPWVAEVDLLLSDLCRPVGYEQYVMESAARSYLLGQMEQALGKERIEAVAKLLIAYVRQLAKTNPFLSRRELRSQQWAAMVYLDAQREEAVRQIAITLQQGMGEHLDEIEGFTDRSEVAHLSRITQELAPQLRDYPNLIQFADLVSRILIDPSLRQSETAQQSYSVLPRIDLKLPGVKALSPFRN